MRSRYPSSSTLAYSFGPGGPVTPVDQGRSDRERRDVRGVARRAQKSFCARSGPAASDRNTCACGRCSRTCSCTRASFTSCSTCSRCGCSAWSWNGRGAAGSFGKFYAVCGIAAGVTQIVVSFAAAAGLRTDLLRADRRRIRRDLRPAARLRVYFPSRSILMFFVFPVPVRCAVAIMGGMALVASIDGSSSGVCKHGASRRARRRVFLLERRAHPSPLGDRNAAT